MTFRSKPKTAEKYARDLYLDWIEPNALQEVHQYSVRSVALMRCSAFLDGVKWARRQKRTAVGKSDVR